MRAAKFDFVHRVDTRDTKLYDYVVKPGDSLDRIARQQGTTTDVLRSKNSTTTILRPGQRLQYQKVFREKAIVGWRSINVDSIPVLYNGHGDNMYAKKLAYAKVALSKKREVACGV
jgi:LysM repeat protein